jgi:hypothetical protein
MGMLMTTPGLFWPILAGLAEFRLHAMPSNSLVLFSGSRREVDAREYLTQIFRKWSGEF